MGKELCDIVYRFMIKINLMLWDAIHDVIYMFIIYANWTRCMLRKLIKSWTCICLCLLWVEGLKVDSLWIAKTNGNRYGEDWKPLLPLLAFFGLNV